MSAVIETHRTHRGNPNGRPTLTTVDPPGIDQISDAVAIKAHTLLEQGRVAVPTKRPDMAMVFGFSGVHTVRAWRRGVARSCIAGRVMGVRCAHVLAAMVAWAEREDRRAAVTIRDEADQATNRWDGWSS